MARQARRVKNFGTFLRETRGERSRQSVVNQIRPFGIAFDPSALAKYEDEGRVPPADVLRGVGLAYGLPLPALIDRLLSELGADPVDWIAELSVSGIDLLRQPDQIYIAPQHGGAGDAAAARIQELEGQLKERETRLREAEDVARRLFRIFAIGDEGGAPRKPKRESSRSDRKAG